VTAEDLRTGRLVPAPGVEAFVSGGDAGWLAKQVVHYAEALERAGKYTLYLWPEHVLLGGEGHALVGAIEEARLFHAYARTAQAAVEIKGRHPLTENYSVFAPEVTSSWDGGSLAGRNDAFFDRLLAADAIAVAGQASSHCVKSSVDDLLEEILRRDPRLVSKVYVLEDCMSAVAVPDPVREGAFLADFTPQAEAAKERWREAGLVLVKSTDPLESWPGLELI
jgi:nicotinamidase-related amidase